MAKAAVALIVCKNSKQLPEPAPGCAHASLGFAAAMEEVLAVGPGVSCGVHGGATYPTSERTRTVIPGTKKAAKWVHHEYKRVGTASICLPIYPKFIA